MRGQECEIKNARVGMRGQDGHVLWLKQSRARYVHVHQNIVLGAVVVEVRRRELIRRRTLHAVEHRPPRILDQPIGIADGMSIARVWACRYSK